MLSEQDLSHHTYIKIKTEQEPIGLSTEFANFPSLFYVNDFQTKKNAILHGLGFGWLPDYLIQKELKTGRFKKLFTEFDHSHIIYPALYHRPENQLGQAALQLLAYFRDPDKRT